MNNGCLHGVEMVPHEAEKLSSFPHLWGDLEDITAIPHTPQIHTHLPTSRARRRPKRPGHPSPPPKSGAATVTGVAPTENGRGAGPHPLVAVVIDLVRAVNRDAEVVGLFG
ncbi:hypothetical protein EDD25_2503 [Cryobacterium psychrophilum]|nr:hypothetical protein EDD25_2503 [Cryobacterium psychrophilum]